MENIENTRKNDRFFLFLNLTMQTIIRLVNEQLGIDEITMNHHEYTMKFFTFFPNYPITKLRVRPFEAYIAPTENIIHDGCCSSDADPASNRVSAQKESAPMVPSERSVKYRRDARPGVGRFDLPRF